VCALLRDSMNKNGGGSRESVIFVLFAQLPQSPINMHARKSAKYFSCQLDTVYVTDVVPHVNTNTKVPSRED
jgi:hypothetical protein